MALMRQKLLVTMKLPQLQNLVKRDPKSYSEEFFMQLRHFESELALFKLNPSKESSRFMELVTFIAHTCGCYRDDPQVRDIPNKLISLMENMASVLHPDVRSKLLTSLILLRNRDMIEAEAMVRLAFKLFAVNDKALRASLVEYIIADIKSANYTKRDDRLNRRIQAVLFGIVSDDTTIAAKKSVSILCQLYRLRIWTDARTVNVIAAACISPSASVMTVAVHFFLGIESKMIDDEDDDRMKRESTDVNLHEHSKKTKKRLRSVKKQQDKISKSSTLNEQGVFVPLFPAIQLIHDPQTLVEKLLKRTRQSTEGFEIKLLCLNFISRLIGCHKLIFLSFYRSIFSQN
jgi:protein SDA1